MFSWFKKVGGWHECIYVKGGYAQETLYENQIKVIY